LAALAGSPIIRECVAEDMPAVATLHETFAQEGVIYGYVAATYDELLTKLGSYFLVASLDDQVVGYIYGSVHTSQGLAVIPADETYLEVGELYLLPAWREHGLGGLLLERLLAVSAAQGIKRYLVYSANKEIERVLRFYQRHGFKSWCVLLYQ
jgi:ribosomal protein S18 acetylase RimI-like enzyme